MNEKELETSPLTSDELSARFQAVCEDFERAWNSGTPPEINDYLSGFAGMEKSRLFSQLLKLDIDIRRRLNHEVTIAQYLETFPYLKNSIEDAFRSSLDSARAPHQRVSTASPQSLLLSDRYRLEKKIGQGGMGSVWKAEQLKPVHRTVAVKLIRKGLDSQTVLQRFEAERQALAMMDHPNIATVLDAGTTEDRQPYFVMEFVDGEKITRFCTRRKLTLSGRLQLFLQVCAAMEHAHRKGVIHRDIKPTNVLVADAGGDGIPKVIDFGVAKAMSKKLTQETMQTEIGHLLGTPEYMSPEQADLTEQDIDTRSDVYSLGILLFELVSGTTPIDSRGEEKPLSVLEVLRRVREQDAPRLSHRLQQENSQVSPRAPIDQLSIPIRRIQKELDWIVLKSLEKDREDRYSSVSELADDIDRFLGGQPVLAHPPSTLYRVRKFVARHKIPVIASTLLLLSLVAGIVGTSWGMFEARRQSRLLSDAKVELEKTLAIANKNSEFALGTLNSVVVSIDDALSQTPGLSSLRREILKHIYRNLDQFSNELMDQQVAAYAVVRTHVNLAQLFRKIGDKDGRQPIQKAERHLARAVAIAEEIYERDEQSLEAMETLAYATEQSSLHLQRVGKVEEAESHAKTNLKLRERLFEADPENDRYRFRLATALFDLGNLDFDLGNEPAAARHYERMVKLMTVLTQKPEVPLHVRQAEAGSHFALSSIASSKGDFAQAIREANNALVVTNRTLLDFPNDVDSLLNVAEIETELGNLYFDQGQFPNAEEFFSDSIRTHQSNIQRFPERIDLKEYLGESRVRLAETWLKQNRPDQSYPLLQQAIEDLEPVCAEDRERVWAHGSLSEAFELQAGIDEKSDRQVAIQRLQKSLATLQVSASVRQHFRRDIDRLKRKLAALTQ